MNIHDLYHNLTDELPGLTFLVRVHLWRRARRHGDFEEIEFSAYVPRWEQAFDGEPADILDQVKAYKIERERRETSDAIEALQANAAILDECRPRPMVQILEDSIAEVERDGGIKA